MSPYSQLFVLYGLMLACIVAAIAGARPWAVIALLMLVIFSLVWPRCPSCRLPIYWNKRPSDPDHFAYYIGKFPFAQRICGRCGAELDRSP
jgi:hypothetical protein